MADHSSHNDSTNVYTNRWGESSDGSETYRDNYYGGSYNTIYGYGHADSDGSGSYSFYTGYTEYDS